MYKLYNVSEIIARNGQCKRKEKVLWREIVKVDIKINVLNILKKLFLTFETMIL